MNEVQSTDHRRRMLKGAIKENTITSFNAAGNCPVDYIEFDVQVTKDGCPIIFHDNFILTEDGGTINEKRVTELTLAEFLSHGPQKEENKIGKPLLRKTKDGEIVNWDVDADDSLCTLQEAFEKVTPYLGFNIELKLNDNIVYQQDHLTHVLQSILRVVFHHAKDRPIIFSTFHPDAALLVRNLQNTYPVFFLTDAGYEMYNDSRRNSLEAAMKVCLEGGLQGIISEVRGIFRNPGAVNNIKEAKLSLLTYGKLNNVVEAVYMQHLMGVNGVIVDSVKEISDAVSNMNMMKPSKEREEEDEQIYVQTNKPFLLKLIPEMITK